MSTLTVIIISFLAVSTAFAGPRVGNGGDARVAEFLSASQEVCKWMGKDPVLKTFEGACFKEWNDLSASVNLKSRKARVYSTESVQDAHGVEKDAVTDLTTRTVIIGAQLWSRNSLTQKQLTAAMEMSLLIGVPNRYEHSQRFLKYLEVVERGAITGDVCKMSMDAMSALTAAYITTFKLCYFLETTGMTSSLDYEEQAKMARHMEELYAASSILCVRNCNQSRSCRGINLKGACNAGK